MGAKKKSSNPLDAHRKAARQRELKKNREQRDRARESSLVQRDTRSLEQDIRTLELRLLGSSSDNDGGVAVALAQRKAELERINTAKESYLRQHPEHRKFVFPHEGSKNEMDNCRKGGEPGQQRNQQQPDPRRSVYFHETFNPLGAPPPGMPYLEKPLDQWEAEQRADFEARTGAMGATESHLNSDAEDNEEEDEGEDEDEKDERSDDEDGVRLPQGPPPFQPVEECESDTSADSDGIVMPTDPPPTEPPTAPRVMSRLPEGGTNGVFPPLPPGPTPPWAFVHARRPPPMPVQQTPLPHIPNTASHLPHYGQPLGTLPPSWQHHQYPYASHERPPPRPQPFTRPQSSATSGPPTQPGPPPPRPAAVISAAPVLRDLKKEATTFVPTALRKKQAAERARAAKGGLPSVVNAAPSAHDDEEMSSEKMDLMAALRPHLEQQRRAAPVPPEESGRLARSSGPADDDYQKFLGEVGELL